MFPGWGLDWAAWCALDDRPGPGVRRALRP